MVEALRGIVDRYRRDGMPIADDNGILINRGMKSNGTVCPVAPLRDATKKIVSVAQFEARRRRPWPHYVRHIDM